MRKSIHIILITLVSVVFAAEDGEIRIAEITPGLRSDSLVISARFEDLYSEKIKGTIQSGLPSIVQIELRLIENSKKVVNRRLIVRNIKYDIWAERYTISNGKTSTFTSFDDVKLSTTKLERMHISHTIALKSGSTYSVRMRVGIIPISALQANRVSDWLRDPHQTEERVASDDRSGGFELNLNKLISYFVNRNKKSEYTSDWYSSGSFKLEDLNR